MLRLEHLENEKKTSVLEEPISKAIISRAISKKSIRVSDLPLERLPTLTTLIRLYIFEKWGLLESKIEFKQTSCERVFYPTKLMSEVTSMTETL
jgi:hypothetical protein